MNTTLLVIGIIVLVIGIIMIIVGISLHSWNVQNNNGNQPWYVWFLIIAGLIIAIIGGFMMAWSSTRAKKVAAACPPPPAKCNPQTPGCMMPPPPMTNVGVPPGVYPGTSTTITNAPLGPTWSPDINTQITGYDSLYMTGQV